MKINRNKIKNIALLSDIYAGDIFSFAPGDKDWESDRIFIKTDEKAFVELSDGTQYSLYDRAVNNGNREVILYPNAELNLND